MLFAKHYTKGLIIGVGVITTASVTLYFFGPLIQKQINKTLLASGKNTSRNLIQDEIIQKKLEEKLVILLKKESVRQQLVDLAKSVLSDESVKKSLMILMKDTLQKEETHSILKETIKKTLYNFFR